eukprot:g13454.t1
MFYLWEALFEELRDVAGAIVEVGVWKGGMSMLLAYAELSKIAIEVAMADPPPPPPLRPGDELTEQQNINVEPDEIHTTRTTRDLYLYDTFEGMPIELDATDVSAYVVKTYEKIKRTKATEEGEREFLESTGKMYHDGERIRWNYGSLDMVKQNLHSTGYSKSRLHFVKGRVEDTLQVAENLPKKIALLRLDTDLYSSTKIELRKLYPLLQPGGVLQVDDYCAWAGARRAVNEFLLRGLDWRDSDRTTTSEEDAAVDDHAHVEDDQQFGFHQLRSKTLSVKDFGAIAELDIVGTTANMLNGPLCFTAVKRRKPITDLEALRRLRYVHSCRKEKIKKLTVASKKFIVQSADSTRVVKWNKQCALPYFWSEINYRMPRWYLQWHRQELRLQLYSQALHEQLHDKAKSWKAQNLRVASLFLLPVCSETRLTFSRLVADGTLAKGGTKLACAS